MKTLAELMLRRVGLVCCGAVAQTGFYYREAGLATCGYVVLLAIRKTHHGRSAWARAGWGSLRFEIYRFSNKVIFSHISLF